MTTHTTTKACADCIHWNSIEPAEGECRRHAPQMISFEVDDETQLQSVFPQTDAEDWCGDFEQK